MTTTVASTVALLPLTDGLVRSGAHGVPPIQPVPLDVELAAGFYSFMLSMLVAALLLLLLLTTTTFAARLPPLLLLLLLLPLLLLWK